MAMKRLFGRVPKDCAEVGKILQQYLDVELDAASASRVLSHLEDCRNCGLELETYHRIKDSVSRQVRPDSGALDRLRAFADELAKGKANLDPDDH